eukprot:gene4857-5325_t
MRASLLFLAFLSLTISTWLNFVEKEKVVTLASATEISFQRAGEDDSLPLSAKYRANLRRLCSLLKQAEHNPSLLPKEWQTRKTELKALCGKLEKDDRMEAAAGSSSFWSGDGGRGKWIATTCMVGLLSAFLFLRERVDVVAWASNAVQFLRGIFAKGQSNGRQLGGNEEAKAAREARLNRFSD